MALYFAVLDEQTEIFRAESKGKSTELVLTTMIWERMVEIGVCTSYISLARYDSKEAIKRE